MKDANECLVAGKGKELIDALWGAVPYRPDGIRSGAELWEDIKKPPPAGYEIPYPGLNGKLGGVRLGELVLFTGGLGHRQVHHRQRDRLPPHDGARAHARRHGP